MQVTSAANLNGLAPAAPAPNGQAADAAPPQKSPFAKMLNAHKAPAKPEAKPAAAKPEAKTQAGDEATEAHDTTAPESSKKTLAGRRGLARADLREHATHEKKTAEASTEPVALPQDKAEARPDDTRAPEADPSLTQFVAAALAKPVAAQAQAGDAVPGEAAKAAAAAIVGADGATPAVPASEANAATQNALHLPGRVDPAARDSGKDSAKPMGTKALEALADAQSAPTGHATPAAQREAAEVFKLPELPPAPVAASTTAMRAEGVAAAGPSASVNIPTPATSPEFHEALGVQVSVLAKDGIQRAELHLNPAEMGPISVQIAIDGTQARVDFGVDSFTTRQIIESGLPELAASLRDAGFTLAGGGVSQQSREKHEGGQGEQRFGTPGERGEDKGSAAQRVNLRLPQGAVDLYA